MQLSLIRGRLHANHVEEMLSRSGRNNAWRSPRGERQVRRGVELVVRRDNNSAVAVAVVEQGELPFVAHFASI